MSVVAHGIAINRPVTPLYDWVADLSNHALFSGSIERGCDIRMMSTGKTYEVKEVGIFKPKQTRCDRLEAGDVGYVVANMKSSAEVKIGDTITESARPCATPLPGFKEIQPMVFSGAPH